MKNIPENTREPYDFFKLIFDDEYFSKIVKNSNEYKDFKIKNLVAASIIEKYIALEILKE